MKKLFLILSIVANTLTFSYAAPLDDVFKDIEVSGVVRYRYETQRVKKTDHKNKKHKVTNRTEITIK
ncbi:mini-MOMP protein [Campylobacter coli]|nr:mini-MOMP protein [Campylobacter coli]EDO6595348.1 mini-MOMP protein [Campylobacter coli]EGK8254825.1 mini-MOMP protein [Campylobacter coli]HEB9319473.1 mini-MOMP protein [Campylobacter coli]HEB9352122.1 mini-MOMP protein [Campylobacter coli]